MDDRMNIVRLINECTALRRIIQEDGIGETQHRAIRTHLLALLADMERRKKRRERAS